MNIRKITLTGIFTALIIVGAFVKIPAVPVPVTMQSFFVLLAGILLGGKYAALSVFIYVFLGLLGFPVFSAGGGAGYIFKPTFGFLPGLILSGFLLGSITNHRRFSVSKLFFYSYLSLIPMYITGILYYIIIMKFFMNTSMDLFKIVYVCYIIFIPFDLLKCFMTAVLGKRLKIEFDK